MKNRDYFVIRFVETGELLSELPGSTHTHGPELYSSEEDARESLKYRRGYVKVLNEDYDPKYNLMDRTEYWKAVEASGLSHLKFVEKYMMTHNHRRRDFSEYEIVPVTIVEKK